MVNSLHDRCGYLRKTHSYEAGIRSTASRWVDGPVALIHIYGDESSQNGHKYMVLGTIWENPIFAAEIEREAAALRSSTGFYKEFHWTDVKGHQVHAYCRLIDLFKMFMNQGKIKFRAIVVDQSDRRHQLYSGTDDELHFYKMWFWLINKRIRSENQYDVYLDRKSNSVPGRLGDLKEALNNRARIDWSPTFRTSVDPIRTVQPLDGTQIELQMADVFAGMIAYFKNGHHRGGTDKNPKLRVLDYALQTLGLDSFQCHWSHQSVDFNIWCFVRN